MELPDTRNERRADFAFAGLIVAAIILMALFYLAFPSVAVLLLVSALLAYALVPLVDRLGKRLPRALAVAIVGLGVLGLLGGAVAVSAPLVARQLKDSDEISKNVKEMGQKGWAKLKGALPDQAEPKAEEAKNTAVNEATRQAPGGKNMAELAKKAGAAISGFASALVFIPVFVALMLFAYHRLLKTLLTAVPAPWKARFQQRSVELDDALSGFVRGQMINCLILAVLYSVAFTLIGIPMGIVIGIFSGFSEIIPYIGNAVALSLGALMAFAAGHPMDAVWVVVAFAAIQALEAFVLAPLVVGKKAKLRPMALLLALALGGELFGIMGLLLAVPTAAALKVAARVFTSAWQRTAFYERGERAAAH